MVRKSPSLQPAESEDGARSKRSRRPDARPGEILEAALALFSEKGFAATRLEDVAARAGLSKAAIYLYFDDKFALLKAVIVELVGANIGPLAARVAAHQGPVAPLLREFLLLIANRIQHTQLPNLVKLIISESRAHPEIGRLYIENVLSKAMPMVESIIARGVASGEFRQVDVSLTVKCLVGPMILAAIWRSVFQPLGAPPLDAEALARQHAELILAALCQTSPAIEPSQSGSPS